MKNRKREKSQNKMAHINERFDSINEFDALEDIDLTSPESLDKRYVMMAFTAHDDYSLMRAFARDATSLGVQTVDCGMEGAQLLVQFDKIWVALNEETELFLSIKYKDLMNINIGHERMIELLRHTDSNMEGNKNVFLSMCMIGFAYHGRV